MRSTLPGRLRGIGAVFAVALVAAAGAVIGAAPASAASACTDVDVVVARGTGEPGQLGIIVGDPVFTAIQRRLSSGTTATGTPVDYPASLSPTSPTDGNRALVAHVTAQAQACPGQRFILVGYSQGANVVGNSLGISSQGAAVGGPVVATIPSSIQPRVAAVLVFGYPLRKLGRGITGTYAQRTLDICAPLDIVCDPLGTSTLAHLSYGNNATQAATFAVARL